jgi:hypothetical protein
MKVTRDGYKIVIEVGGITAALITYVIKTHPEKFTALNVLNAKLNEAIESYTEETGDEA